MPTDWLRQAGQVHEYTPPVFFKMYGFFPDPFTSTCCPSAMSATLSSPREGRRVAVVSVTGGAPVGMASEANLGRQGSMERGSGGAFFTGR